MKIVPLRDIVLVQADKDTNKTASGLHLAREWEKLPHTGEVISIGPEVTTVQPGQKVHFNRYAFQQVEDRLFLGIERNINAVLK